MAGKGFFQYIPEWINQAKLKMNKKLLVLLIFVGIASFFWFLRALEQDYITTIQHPVIYTNLPDNKVLVNEMPKKLEIEVEGKGSVILNHNWDISKSPIRINFQQIYSTPIERNKDTQVELSSSQIKPRVENQLSDLKVRSINPNSLVFLFSETIIKKVPVVANLDYVLEKDFMIRDGIIIIPDSVEVSGPAALVDTITSISTNNVRIRKLDHTIKRNLTLINPDELISLSAKKVAIEIPIEQYTEKTLTVPIDGINVPDSVHLKTFPANTQITFRVVISAFDLIKSQDFRIVVDYLEIDPASPAKIKPHILVAPGLIENPRINPEMVDYLLEQK